MPEDVDPPTNVRATKVFTGSWVYWVRRDLGKNLSGKPIQQNCLGQLAQVKAWSQQARRPVV
jgi:hypothetical protein